MFYAQQAVTWFAGAFAGAGVAFTLQAAGYRRQIRQMQARTAELAATTAELRGYITQLEEEKKANAG